MKILICGDSFAADWTIKYPDKKGWPNLLAEHHNVINLAQAGCGEYKILLQLLSVDFTQFDQIIVYFNDSVVQHWIFVTSPTASLSRKFSYFFGFFVCLLLLKIRCLTLLVPANKHGHFNIVSEPSEAVRDPPQMRVTSTKTGSCLVSLSSNTFSIDLSSYSTTAAINALLASHALSSSLANYQAKITTSTHISATDVNVNGTLPGKRINVSDGNMSFKVSFPRINYTLTNWNIVSWIFSYNVTAQGSRKNNNSTAVIETGVTIEGADASL